MPEEPARQTPKRTKGMLAFYVGTGIVVALLAAAYFGWTPLRVRYYEWQVMRERTHNFNSPLLQQHTKERRQAARQLIAIGPPAAPAVRRIVFRGNLMVREAIFSEIANSGTSCMWCLPYIARWIRGNAIPEDGVSALIAAQRTSGMTLVNVRENKDGVLSIDYADGRKRFLDWWEKEGKGKYGSSK